MGSRGDPSAAEGDSPDGKGLEWLERNARRLDFLHARDQNNQSWRRAREHADDAAVEEVDRDWFRVELPDGADEHDVVLVKHGREGDAFVGACDCDGFEYNGQCAHLCALARRDVLERIVPVDAERAIELASSGDPSS